MSITNVLLLLSNHCEGYNYVSCGKESSTNCGQGAVTIGYVP